MAKMGAPTKYKEGLADKWLKCVEGGEELIKASHKVGLNYSTILDWTKKHKDFSKAYKRAKEIDQVRIIDRANLGNANPAWFMFLLKCNHGYIERDKKDSIDIRKKELDSRINGDIKDQVIKIEYTKD